MEHDGLLMKSLHVDCLGTLGHFLKKYNYTNVKKVIGSLTGLVIIPTAGAAVTVGRTGPGET